MLEEMTKFLEAFQEMRKAQNRFLKSTDKIDQTKAMQLQLQLDKAAPILLEVIKTERQA